MCIHRVIISDNAITHRRGFKGVGGFYRRGDWKISGFRCDLVVIIKEYSNAKRTQTERKPISNRTQTTHLYGLTRFWATCWYALQWYVCVYWHNF